MKNPKLYNWTLLLFLFPMLLYGAHNGPKGKYTKEKTLKKEYAVNSDATLHIDNSYGNIQVVAWNQNKITIEVHITTNGNDEKNVQQKLDDITVEFKASPSMVSAETIFDQNSNKSWWSGWFDNDSVNMEINYTVKMPMTNNAFLNNDYGNIKIGDLEGRAVINCDYGKITTGKLRADNNSLTFDYSNNCYFEYIKSGTINADYSGFTIGGSQSLEIAADYTDSTVEKAENVTFSCDYGKINIEQVGQVKGNGDYLTIHLGEVGKNVNLVSDYGSIKIERMLPTAGSIFIDANYTDIKIGVASGRPFVFDIDMEYASLDAFDGLTYTEKNKDGSDRLYRGYYISEDTGNRIKIETDYGDVSLSKE